jgi:hypothetical protein
VLGSGNCYGGIAASTQATINRRSHTLPQAQPEHVMHPRVRPHFNRIDRPAQSAARRYALAMETAESEGWPMLPASPRRPAATPSGKLYFRDDGGPIATQVHDDHGHWSIVQSTRAWLG